MRWICKDHIQLNLTMEWLEKAEAVSNEIKSATTPQEKKAILKKSNSIWREFYDLLPESLKKKCWYCEAEEIRSDMPVDHFRPKSKIADVDQHEGYWWLAFDWENYRCACTYCNSLRNFEETQGGKACKFPIFNSNSRAYCPSDDYHQEHPAFLDPYDPDDWKLLWFDNDGKPEAIATASNEEKQKVQNSIEIFHLHETKIVRKRKAIRLDIEKEIKTLKKAEGENDRETLKNTKSKLRKMVQETEKLSRAAIVYLRQHRELPAVKAILDLD